MKKIPSSVARTQTSGSSRLTRVARTIKPSTRADPTLLVRPDGIYWQTAEGDEAFGPFETYELARADFLRGDEERPAPGESLNEAESELGQNTWVDEETGQVAEGQSPLHVQRP